MLTRDQVRRPPGGHGRRLQWTECCRGRTRLTAGSTPTGPRWRHLPGAGGPGWRPRRTTRRAADQAKAQCLLCLNSGSAPFRHVAGSPKDPLETLLSTFKFQDVIKPWRRLITKSGPLPTHSCSSPPTKPRKDSSIINKDLISNLDSCGRSFVRVWSQMLL